MRVLNFAIATLILTLGGCGGPDGDDESLPTGMSGYFHLDTGGDSYNFILGDSGDFEWGSNGCDYLQGDFGTWERRGADSVVIRPSAESRFEDRIEWPFSYADPITQVTLTRQADGSIRALAEGDADPLTSLWLTGAICPICESGSLVPSGQEPCADPIMPSDWYN